MPGELREEVRQVLSRVRLPRAQLDHRTQWVTAAIEVLLNDPDTSGLLWGGSLHRDRGDEWSDCDLFCITGEDAREKRDVLLRIFGAFDGVRLSIPQPSFPWFGELLTMIFDDEYSFSIDVGLVPRSLAPDFFWEPTGLIVNDPSGVIQGSISRRRSSLEANPFGPRMPLATLTVLALKLRKSLVRGNLWNALEYVQQSRRILMFMLRAVYRRDAYLGRPDRDVEQALQPNILGRLQETCAGYSEVEIGRAAGVIIRWGIEIARAAQFDLNERVLAELEKACRWFEDSYE